MPRPEKVAAVEELAEKLPEGPRDRPHRLPRADGQRDDRAPRRELRKVGVEFKVVKNTLTLPRRPEGRARGAGASPRRADRHRLWIR